jgi:ATP-dependent helicase/nuclease subunit B
VAVTILFGKGGSGKTTCCFSQIQSWAEQNGKALLLVPDQATYGIERRLAESMPGKGFMGIQVVGFSRLAYRVFQNKEQEHASLSELGRKIILQRLLRQHQEDCSILQTAARQPHFVSTVGQFIWECRSFNIGPDDLRNVAQTLGTQTLSRKLHDIALLYDGYMDFLQDHYGSNDDMMTLLIQEIPNDDYLRGAHIWVDGFQWFTPQQLEVLRTIEMAAGHLTITLTMDASQLGKQARETALFHRPYAVYQDLRKYFPHLETETIESAPPTAIQPFTDEFFQMVPRQREAAVKNISVTECTNRDVEIDAVARHILRLCHQGYRYRDFLILVRNSDAYSATAERIFSHYGIPLFSDYRRPMTSHPIAEAISALFDVFRTHWAYEPLFRLLKTDLFPMSRHDTDELENYCLAYGIQGYHWLNGKKWKYGRNRYLEEQNSVDAAEEEKLVYINDLRKKVTDTLQPFWEESQTDHTLQEWCTFLYQWLVRLQVPETLRRWQVDDREAGRTLEGKEHEQVWKRILAFLDEMVRLCGDDTVTLREFSQMVTDGLDELKFSLIPPTLDHVTLTSVERGYTMRAKIVFLCGVNDGVFPKHNSEAGLLNDQERKQLDTLGVKLGPGSRFRSFQERFLFYLAATRATEQFHLSYILSDEDGGAMEPSSWIYQMEDKKYIETVCSETGEIPSGRESEFIVAVPASLAYLPEKIQPATEGYTVDDVWWALYDWALENGFDRQAVQTVQGLFHHNQSIPLPPALVRKLYAPDGTLRGSVTKFEQYRQCPFAYFANYGLGLEERPLYRFAAPDLGMLVHGALKILGEDLITQQRQWHDLRG